MRTVYKNGYAALAEPNSRNLNNFPYASFGNSVQGTYKQLGNNHFVAVTDLIITDESTSPRQGYEVQRVAAGEEFTCSGR